MTANLSVPNLVKMIRALESIPSDAARRNVHLSHLVLLAEEELADLYVTYDQLREHLDEIDSDLAERLFNAAGGLWQYLPELVDELRSIHLEAARGARRFFDDLLGVPDDPEDDVREVISRSS